MGAGECKGKILATSPFLRSHCAFATRSLCRFWVPLLGALSWFVLCRAAKNEHNRYTAQRGEIAQYERQKRCILNFPAKNLQKQVTNAKISVIIPLKNPF
jgi:hypothetical protein